MLLKSRSIHTSEVYYTMHILKIKNENKKYSFSAFICPIFSVTYFYLFNFILNKLRSDIKLKKEIFLN